MVAKAQGGTSLDALASLMQLFQGQKTNSTQTTSTPGFSETSQTNFDQETLAGMLKSALESNQGLAATAQGQRGAGLYNSSTNRLMTNDLLSRLTARTAEAGASKTTTRTPGPAGTVSTNQQVGGLTQGGTSDLAKLMGGIKLYNEASKSDLFKKGLKTAGGYLASDAAAGASGAAATAFNTAGPASFESLLAGFDGGMAAAPEISAGVPSVASDLSGLFSMDMAGDFAQSFGQSFAGDAGSSAVVENVGNFPTASANQSMMGSVGSNPSSSEILSGAQSPSADTTSLSNTSSFSSSGNIASVAGGSFGSASLGAAGSSGLGTATAGISYGASTPSSLGSISTGYDLGSSAAGDVSSSAGGSIAGYIGPIMSAFNAQNNPEGEMNKDYRHAVGSAVLNYFGFGWAAPVVGAIAQPLLNASMEAGVKSMGTFGAVLADPIGAPLSGEYDVKELITSTLDPANIFGGNPGGSVGSVAALGIDPIGAALGGEGVFGVASSAINKVDSAISPGRVVCTELALAGDISIAKYQKVIQPSITLKGRILLGYHLLGIPAVRKLRADSKFRARAIPYVNAYLEHKLGNHNLIGFLIKNLGEPLCWILSFFNKDPEAYKTLYPYRRDRKNQNGCQSTS